MLRKEIESLMKKSNKQFISLVYKQTDKLGMLCYLKSGFLCDCWGHRVPLKQNIWGIIVKEGNNFVHYPIEEKINEVLFCQ